MFGVVKYCTGNKRLGRRDALHFGGFSYRNFSLCCGKQKIIRRCFGPQGALCLVKEIRQYTAYLDTKENVVSTTCNPELSM